MYAIKIRNLKTNQVHEIGSSVDTARLKESVEEAARWQMINIHGLKAGEWKVLSYRPL